MLAEYLQKYVDAFGENFPIFAFMGDEEDAIKEIKKCLDTGKPYELEVDDEKYY